MIAHPEFRTPHCPDWVKDAVFYQIFPDRFARSPRTRHPRGIRLKPWGSPPAEQGYQGGDLRGIVDRLDYLQSLGINALYLNPIFKSAANHRYHTYDYYEVDPLLGGNTALRELLDAAHARHMRIILDGVFNHTGRGFWQFHHILENGGNSPYIDWFFVNDWPLRPYNHDAQNPHNYVSWWDLPALPKFNTDNPGVRDFLLDVARHWIEFGADGWRLDVPAEIDDDQFWRDFRAVVKDANPDAYIVGEIWTPAQRWLQGDQFDAVMNYQFTVPVLNFTAAGTLRPYKKPEYDLQPFDAEQFAAAVDQMYALYQWEINFAQLNLLDSHDTARALWIMGDDKSALRLAAFLQMTMLGAPCIYYGDEIGLSAGDDPDCRGAFPWDDEPAWDQDLLAHYRRLTALRHDLPALRRGAFKPLYARDTVYAFSRILSAPDGTPQYEALVCVNTATKAQAVEIPLPAVSGSRYIQAWPDQETSYAIQHGRLAITVPPRAGLILVNA